MSEWWTYSLRDLLLFSPGTYYRLFELHNQEWWPLPLLMVALGTTVSALAWRGGERAGRLSLGLLAACWLWVGWAWHGQRYASINWVAGYVAWVWVAQGLLLGVAALRGGSLTEPVSRWQRRTGWGLLVLALAYPLLAVVLGRGWGQAEVLGMAPDPTALATLGLLLAHRVRHAGWLSALPVVWCLVSGATLWAMASPEWWCAPLAAFLVVLARAYPGNASRAAASRPSST